MSKFICCAGSHSGYALKVTGAWENLTKAYENIANIVLCTRKIIRRKEFRGEHEK